MKKVLEEGRFSPRDSDSLQAADLVSVCYKYQSDVPVKDQHGKFYKQKVSDGESAHAVAARLTKLLRLTLIGKDQDRVGAKRELKYPDLGLA